MIYVYHYDRKTNVYIGKEVADKSPLESDVYLLPKYATFEEPPEYDAKNEVVVWENEQWLVKRLKERCSLEKSINKANIILLQLYNQKLSNFKFNNMVFICDLDFRVTILESKEMIDFVEEFYINSKEGIHVFSKDQFKDFYKDYIKFKQETFKWKKCFEKYINNCVSIEELEFLLEDISSGTEEPQKSDEV